MPSSLSYLASYNLRSFSFAFFSEFQECIDIVVSLLLAGSFPLSASHLSFQISSVNRYTFLLSFMVQDVHSSFPYSILISQYEVKGLLLCLIIFLSLLPRLPFQFLYFLSLLPRLPFQFLYFLSLLPRLPFQILYFSA